MEGFKAIGSGFRFQKSADGHVVAVSVGCSWKLESAVFASVDSVRLGKKAANFWYSAC